ncbi:penicillin acylase family protein [Nocardioides sp. LML1-1-1.1]|uniref:penicillin acylase family protein n=1 Tax=Nocardioides sp. LML1-1-1.1 TaxID=3135248 RepID=UPI00343DC3F7
MITRDAWGIPQVSAGSVLEVAREQGRVTARDRGWQLEVERRRAEGTCAEVFGESGREWDLLVRRSLLADTARRAYAALAAESRAFVDAYVEGVNEVVERPWQRWTPLGVFAVQHLLFSRFPSKLWQDHLARVLGPDAVGALALLRTEGLPGGSNAVAVSGARTASGLPLVAGDPHRVIEAAGCYQQVRLVCTDPADAFDVAGLTFVGVPGIQHFGHAGSVAWGVTNAVADDEDVYVEELVRHAGAVVARGASGWEPVARRVDTMRVRTGPDRYDAEQVEVLVTERGPVVVGGPGTAATFSLRTPAFVLGDLGFDALLPLLRARTTADVVDAFAHWVGPVDNLLVADAADVVEHRVVGRVPARDAVTGTWTGWVADLPRRTGAATGGVLVSANDRATEDFARIGDDFAPPYRAARITALLADGVVTPERVADVLADDLQTAGAALLDLAARLADLTAPAAALRDRLLGWDRRMAADSVDAALFAAVRAAVVEAFAASPVLAGADVSPYGEMYAPWFDLRARLRLALPALLVAEKPFAVDPLAAVAAALEEVAVAPTPPAWGSAHLAYPLTPHQQFGQPAPEGHAPPLVPLAGDDDCVQATRAIGGTGVCVHGPVARFVWDLAGASRWVVPLGAAADPASVHHADQQAAWAAGRTIPLEDR